MATTSPNIIVGQAFAEYVSMEATISYALIADVFSVSMTGDAGMSVGIVSYIPELEFISGSGTVITSSNIDGLSDGLSISMSGSMIRTNSIDADITINTLVSMVGEGSFAQSVIDGDATIFIITAQATVTQGNIPNLGVGVDVLGDTIIVVNLRTKTHTTYISGTNNARATTGILNLGSFKRKNISDVLVYGRADDNGNLVVTTDEVTKRNYPITFKNCSPNLINKRIKLAKGIAGVGWQLGIENEAQIYNEVRTIDLFVSELQRHV